MKRSIRLLRVWCWLLVLCVLLLAVSVFFIRSRVDVLKSGIDILTKRIDVLRDGINLCWEADSTLFEIVQELAKHLYLHFCNLRQPQAKDTTTIVR